MININQKLKDADFVALLADESCDISVHKKLCTYCRIVKDCKPQTIFLENSNIPDGTAETVTNSLVKIVTDRNIDRNKILAFGSDGASVSSTFYKCTCNFLIIFHV